MELIINPLYQSNLKPENINFIKPEYFHTLRAVMHSIEGTQDLIKQATGLAELFSRNLNYLLIEPYLFTLLANLIEKIKIYIDNIEMTVFEELQRYE